MSYETAQYAAHGPVPQSVVNNLIKSAELDVKRNLGAELQQAETETNDEIADRIDKFGM